tara:strand:+ start:471 stop:1256 length:786 start_codon:yes stop_codon:yes gene_type:complete
MSNYVQYQDPTDTSASPSPVIWGDCPVNEIIATGNGVYMMEDFIEGTLASATTGNVGVFLDGSCTVGYSNEVNGAVVLTHDGTADDSNSIFGAPAFQISQTSGNLWFEARVKFNTAAADKAGFFVGLMDATAPSEVIPLTAASAMSDHNMVGFHKPEENSAAFDTSYKANGVTAVEVNSNVGALVADTYVKLGMKFETQSNILSFYIDGAKQTSTKTIPSSAGDDFPNDVALKFVMTQLAEAAEAHTMTCDWVRVAQERAV